MTTTLDTEVIPRPADTREFEEITSSLRSFPLEGYAPATAGEYRHARTQPRRTLPNTLLGRPIGRVVRHLIGAAVLGTAGGLVLGLASLPAGPSVAGTPDVVPTVAPQLTPRPAGTGEPEDGAESPYDGSDRTGSSSQVHGTSLSGTARPMGTGEPSDGATSTASTPQPDTAQPVEPTDVGSEVTPDPEPTENTEEPTGVPRSSTPPKTGSAPTTPDGN